MGADHSVPVPHDSEEEEEEEENDEDEEEEEEEEEDEAEDNNGDSDQRRKATENNLVKKVLQQEPEMLPCYASASPLSPQLSSLGTPRLGPSIKVWDPYNVLAPPPHMAFARSFSQGSVDEDRGTPSSLSLSPATEVFLISHGECELGLRPDLIGGRCPEAALTATGKRQARALAVYLNSQGVRFSAVYSSPLDRARSMALSVCQEMNFTEDQIQTSETLTEMSQGHWEGCLRSEIYSGEITSFIENSQPDFSAPAGESLRQVEFRMVSFLNGTVLSLNEKLRSDIPLLHNPHSLIHVSKSGLQRKKSGKSRLQIMTTVKDREAEEETSSQEHDHRNSNSSSLHDLSGRSSSYNHSCIGIFSHAVPIKCLLTGILGCSPLMSSKICVEDSSVTVLQHSWETGWQLKKLNETAHLRLL